MKLSFNFYISNFLRANLKLGSIVQAVDYISHASYQAIILPNSVPTDGFGIVRDPANLVASPSGWNSDGVTTWPDTQGNNLEVNVGSTRALGGPNLTFTSTWTASSQPGTAGNRDASSVNLFYILNTLHDIVYQFGFNEQGKK